MWCSVSFDPTLSVPLFKFLSNYWCRRVSGGSVEMEPDAEDSNNFLMTALRTPVSTSRLNPRADRVCGNSRFACADMDVYIVTDPAVCCRSANRRNDHGPPLNPY